MDYQVNYASIKTVIEEEVSRVASRSYSSDGASQYDSIRLVSRDESTLKRLLEDAVNILLSRFRLFVSVSYEEETTVTFNLPDLAVGMEDRIKSILDRFLGMNVVGKWLQERGIEDSEMYLKRADVSINEAELLMMTRTRINR